MNAFHASDAGVPRDSSAGAVIDNQTGDSVIVH
jgi:hypothetical protein